MLSPKNLKFSKSAFFSRMKIFLESTKRTNVVFLNHLNRLSKILMQYYAQLKTLGMTQRKPFCHCFQLHFLIKASKFQALENVQMFNISSINVQISFDASGEKGVAQTVRVPSYGWRDFGQIVI